MKVIIPSASYRNMLACTSALVAHGVEGKDIIVVDDGCGQSPVGTTISGIKPFCFARNVNLGLSLCKESALLMNDDALLLNSPKSLEQTEFGLLAPAVEGECGLREQWASVRHDTIAVDMVCFVAVYISAETLATVGKLDERFIGYGYEDNDYCRRARLAGIKIGITDKVIVSHPGGGTFRNRPNFNRMFQYNLKLYEEKWP